MDTQLKTSKVYQQVIDYIGILIKDGKLKKGDKIPTERDLSNLLKVSRNSIREALKTLDVIGLVERRQGDGTYIKNQFDECLTEPLSLVFMLEKIEKEEIFEFRNMIEITTVSLAVERITEIELGQLEAVYKSLKDEESEYLRAKYDKDFHYMIAKASKNLLILNNYNVMSSLMDAFISDVRQKVLQDKGKDEEIILLHKDILEALKNKDKVAAEIAIKKHMQVINSYYKEQ